MKQHGVTSGKGGRRQQPDHSVWVYKLAISLLADERETTNKLVVPPATRQVWDTLLDDYSKRPARWVIIGSPGLGKSKCAWYRSVLRAAVCQGAACGRSGRGKQNASGGVRAQDGVQVRAGEPQRPQEKCAATDFADSRECCLQTVDNLHCRRHSSAGQFYPDYGDAGNGPCVLARLVTTPTYNKFAKHADRLYIV